MAQTPVWFPVQCLVRHGRSLISTSLLLLATGCTRNIVAEPSPVPVPIAPEVEETPQTEDVVLSIAKENTVGWAAAEFTAAGFLDGHSHPVRQLIASSDGAYLLGITDQEMVLWDVPSRQLLRFFPGHPVELGAEPVGLPPVDAAFSPNGDRIATVFYSQGISATETLMIWDTATGESVATLGDYEGCRSVAFVNQTTLISACDVGVQVWDLQTLQKTQEFYGFEQSGRPVEALAVAPDASVVATADLNTYGGEAGEDSRLIRLWRLTDTGVEAIAELSGQTSDILQLEFSPNETLLVSQGAGGEAQVWDWEATQQITQLATGFSISDPLIEVAIAPDNQTLAGDFQVGEIIRLPDGTVLQDVLVPRQGPTSAYEFLGSDWLAQAGGLALYPNPVVRLWIAQAQGERTDPPNDLLGNPDYLPIALVDNWNYPMDGPHNRIFGDDPEMIAMIGVVPLEALGEAPENPEVTTEILESQSDRRIVQVTQSGLADDSVQGIRHWVELAPYGVDQWKVIWAGEQYRCRPGRGHEDWGVEPCL
ncbi:MAG: hypothetical protein AAFY26_12855 [Cyanobacteria bacterium J06638_22]